MKYDIESILEMYEDDYTPSAKVPGPRNMKLAEVPRSEMDNFNTPDLDQGADSILRPGETLEDDFDVTFRRPNAQGGRIPFGVGGMPYKIFGKDIDIPKIPGVQGPEQNKKSVEAGFKKLEKWLTDPTPENWVKTFGKNNAFNYQLRNYLQGTKDIGSVKGMNTAAKVFDAINIKSLLKPNQIQKILDLDTGGKGVSLKSKRAKTFGNQKFTMAEQIETIKDFQNGEQWLKRNPDPDKIGPDGKNIYRKYANAIKSMQSEQSRLGGFPFGDNSEKKLWSNLYRASYRGDRIKIVGEFADGNLPINKDGKIDWKMTNKSGTPAWKRVQFVDLQAPKNTSFTWGENFKKGDLKNQIDNTFGQGFFDKSTSAYDVQVRTGSKRDFTKTGGGKTIKSDLKIKLLRAEALAENPKATKKQIDEYIKRKSPRFNITEVHHPEGVGVNPYNTEPTFRYTNRALEREVMQPLKAGTIDINEAKLRIDKINKDIGPIRTKLDDGYYGNYKNTQKSIVEAGNKYVDYIDGKKDFKKGQIKPITKIQSKGIAKKLNAAGFKCQLSNGLTCNDPRAYTQSIKENMAKIQQGDNASISKLNKLGKSMNAFKGAAKFTGWTLLAELGIAAPLAAVDYAKGANKDEIISNATYGLFGKSEDEQLREKYSDYGQAKDFQKTYDKLLKQENALDDQTGYGPIINPQNVKNTQKKFMEQSKQFDSVLPPSQGLRSEFDLNKFLNMMVTDQQRDKLFADQKAQRAEEIGILKPSTGLESYDNFMEGGIASLNVKK